MDNEDFVGFKRNMLTALSFSRLGKKNVQIWLFRCECGKEKEIRRPSVQNGITKSCGCLVSSSVRAARTIHGMDMTAPYRTWNAMKQRCSNPKTINWKRYGGRGIRVCDKWQSFTGFWEEMGPTWAEGLSIERNDLDGDYCFSNCRWATRIEQGSNKSNNINLTCPGGEVLCISAAARKYGISRTLLASRYYRGWPESKLFVAPHAKS